MGGDLYTTAGGSLKIKGVAGSKVEKKKKKKKKVEGEAREGGKADTTATDSPHEAQDDAKALSAVEDVSTGLDADSGKTEAERRHEDLRRQRVCQLPEDSDECILTVEFYSSLSVSRKRV